MEQKELTVLKRDVVGTVVPSGEKLTISKGEQVVISRATDEGYIIRHNNQVVILGKDDSDALGFDTSAKHNNAVEQSQQANHQTTAISPEELEKKMWDALRQCYDPEIPVNIVDLGLVYDCSVEPIEGGGYRANVKMTLTAPGCPVAPMMAQDVQNKLISIEGIEEANVEVVWDPPWTQDMMSEAAKLQLGLL